MQEKIDFQDMESFVMLCRLHSFTRAAQNLFISQSALSRRIRSLEEQLGVELVKRGGTSLETTRAGQWFYQACLRMLKEKEELCGSMHRFHAGEEGKLRLSYEPEAIIWPRVLEAIIHLKNAHPHIQVELRKNDSPDLVNALLANQMDGVIQEMSLIEEHPALSFTLIGEDHLLACLFQGHSLYQQPFLTLEELATEKVVFAFSPKNLDFIRLVNRNNCLGPLLSWRHLMSLEEALCQVTGNGAIALLRKRDEPRYASLAPGLKFLPVYEKKEDTKIPVPIPLAKTALVYLEGNKDPRLKAFLSALAATQA